MWNETICMEWSAATNWGRQCVAKSFPGLRVLRPQLYRSVNTEHPWLSLRLGLSGQISGIGDIRQVLYIAAPVIPYIILHNSDGCPGPMEPVMAASAAGKSTILFFLGY